MEIENQEQMRRLEREMMSPFVKREKFDSKLYSDNLVKFSETNREHMDLVKKQLLNINPCYEFDMVHWHLLDDEKKTKKESKKEPPVEKPLLPTKESANTFFSKASAFDEPAFVEPIDRIEHEKMNSTYCNLCYNECNIRSHLKRERKIRGKPRIPYDNIPLPTVKPKEPSPEPEKNEILYKFIVKTGHGNSYGTNLPVYVTLFGKKGRSRKRQLTKKQGSLSFHFRPGVSETFFIKGPDVGELEYIGVELQVPENPDGPKEHNSWFLDNIVITNLTSKDLDTYTIACKDWFSRLYSDKKLKRKLPVEKEKLVHKEFIVTTFTANEKMASLDAAVYIIFYGSKRNSSKLALRKDGGKPFQRGHKDEFLVETVDFGDLKGIRIGHDGGYSIFRRKQKEKEKGINEEEESSEKEEVLHKNEHFCDWLLERVVLKEKDSGRRYEFSVNKWVGKNFGEADYVDLWLPKMRQKPTSAKRKKEDAHYAISIQTGKKDFAGTDSTIYVEIKGSIGKTKHLKFEDLNKKHFEKGMVDRFDIDSVNVGKMKSLRIWHDDKGVAPGWFCEKVTVERSLTTSDIFEWLNSQREAGNLPQGLTMIDGRVVMVKTTKLTSKRDVDFDNSTFSGFGDQKVRSKSKDRKKKKKSSSSSSSSSDSDDDRKKKGRKKLSLKEKKGRLNESRKSSKERSRFSGSDQEFDHNESSQEELHELDSNETTTISLPYAEEVEFPCNRWLAKDEDDHKVERLLEAKKSRLLFSDVNVRYKIIRPSTNLRLMKHTKSVDGKDTK